MVLLTKALSFLVLIAAVTAIADVINGRTCFGKCIAMGAEVGDKKCWSEEYPVNVWTCMPDGCWHMAEVEDECQYGCVQNKEGTYARCRTKEENTGHSGRPWE